MAIRKVLCRVVLLAGTAIAGVQSAAAQVQPPAVSDPGATTTRSRDNTTAAGTPGTPAVDTAPAAAAAQETSSDAGGNLEDIVVTAQRRSESLQRVPIAVTALSSSTLQTSGVDTGVTLSRVTPNLTITAGQGFYSPYLRGVGSGYATLGLESSVAIYVDDLYMSRPSAGLNTFADIARIEVLKGPQGTLFGRNAAGGAIRFITNDPVYKFEASGSLTYGRFDRVAGEAVLNVPLSSNLAARLSYSHDERDGYIKNVDRTKPRLGNRNIDILRGKLLFEPTDNFKIKVSGDYSYKRDLESAVFISLENAPRQLAVALGGLPSPSFYRATQDYPGDSDNNYSNEQAGVSVRTDWDVGPLTLSSISGYRYANFIARASDGDATSLPFQHNDFREKSDSYSQEVQLVSNSEGPLKYLAGVYYYKEVGGNTFNLYGLGIDALFGVTSGPNVGQQDGGAILGATSRLRIEYLARYVQASYDFSDKLQLLLGGRYTSEKKTLVSNDVYAGAFGVTAVTFSERDRDLKFSKFTPKATLTFRPSRDVMFYGSYSVGFKSGGINTPAVGPADTVAPETLKSYEVGWKTEFGNIRFNGSAFYYDFTGLQVQRVDAATGGLRIENAAAAEIYGLESDIVWAPSSALELAASAGYLHTKYQGYIGDAYVPCDTNPAAAGCAAQGGLGFGTQSTDFSGQSLPQTPKVTFNVRGQYTVELGGNSGSVRLNSGLTYTDSFFWNAEHSLSEPSHFVLTAGATWVSADDRFNVGVFGDNLLNEKINVLKARQTSGGWRIPGPPITWGVRVGAKF